MSSEPIETYDSATVYYWESRDGDESPVRSEDVRVEIYPGWVCISDPTAFWVPRERVQGVHTV